MEETPQHCLSRLPHNSALKQQELPAHQLYFTTTRVLSVFFTTGIFCLCMGIILIVSMNYTRTCANCAELRETASNFDKECTCSIPFYLSEKMMVSNVYMCYKLHGFYQNLYRYIRSRSNRQLAGKDVK
uniref:Cell cycle control protein 50C n=1 Tax=Aotus nancymaae TaxID=37293 RepID=A0A2K5BUR9_AOTNA